MTGILDLPFDASPDPDDYLAAAMEWHFNPKTGSPFWLDKARELDFDPRTDVKTHGDLALFPNVANEFRDVPIERLVPRGYGDDCDILGVYESGGTTGAPKRVVCLRDWFYRMLAWSSANLDKHGFPYGVNWLGILPSGPHIVGTLFSESARSRGGVGFTVDLDPRWVKQLIAGGRNHEAAAYAEHLVDQAAHVLRTQDIGVLTVTPPLLERIARREELAALVNEKVSAIRWGGTQLDPDTRDLYRGEIFPEVTLYGHYGSTMIQGIAGERAGLTGDEPCVFDPFWPYVSFRVVDPSTGEAVRHGERGQVVMNHVSKSFFLPNNVERDTALRMAPLPGGVGDSVADIAPVAVFEDERVVEGVY